MISKGLSKYTRRVETRTALLHRTLKWFYRCQIQKTRQPLQDLSFATARNRPHDDVPISALEAMLKCKSVRWSGEVAAASNEELPVEQESRKIEKRWTNKSVLIAREVKFAVKE